MSFSDRVLSSTSFRSFRQFRNAGLSETEKKFEQDAQLFFELGEEEEEEEEEMREGREGGENIALSKKRDRSASRNGVRNEQNQSGTSISNGDQKMLSRRPGSVDKRLTYYKMLNLSSKVQNPDQYITVDISRFCLSLAMTFSSIGKPVLDMIIFHIQLVNSLGVMGTGSIVLFYLLSVVGLRKLIPSFGKLVASQTVLEGQFRAAHSRIITNAEEIAFYRGQDREKENVESTFEKFMQHLEKISKLRFRHVVVEDMVVKYVWSALGVDYYGEPTKRRGTAKLRGNDYTLVGAKGIVYEDIESIKLTQVPIVAPNLNPQKPGTVLVQPLVWHVKQGDHWFVKGPGGVGKTSLMRVISGLWPVYSGVLEKPEGREVAYIPNRAYLCIGTLRDQIIYPHSVTEMQENGCTDANLLEILEVVSLDYLPAREGGLDVVKEWSDVLSGGERQRICMARMFYHHPMFAILDECTSAVSTDTEGRIYEYAKSIGITLITISHRSVFANYHDYVLRLGDVYASSTPSLGVVPGDEGENNGVYGTSPSADAYKRSLDKLSETMGVAYSSLGVVTSNNMGVLGDATGKGAEDSFAGPAWSDAELVALDEEIESNLLSSQQGKGKSINANGETGSPNSSNNSFGDDEREGEEGYVKRGRSYHRARDNGHGHSHSHGINTEQKKYRSVGRSEYSGSVTGNRQRTQTKIRRNRSGGRIGGGGGGGGGGGDGVAWQTAKLMNTKQINSGGGQREKGEGEGEATATVKQSADGENESQPSAASGSGQVTQFIDVQDDKSRVQGSNIEVRRLEKALLERKSLYTQWTRRLLDIKNELTQVELDPQVRDILV
ncbi:ATP-binding cassette sub-family D member 2 [Zancudomyces culisetae]|uniref:ATP-binding cassette sub-family D member 2 n=1 Tax=Zancudomyces culisetae TaxID=1213189 RepID=A0A1R1PZD2_ZANCU|nr:ATP-binding cassette sub-family D member 2 [Zancudomyces culisetae]|eukprot:OMH86328.1 ATP-binding cassette sub-family D member 2 [Zancudomyces culisetae]